MSACFFPWHKWEPVAVYHYYDVSYDERIPETQVTLKCKKCGDLRSKRLAFSGHVKLSELNNGGAE